MKVPSKRLVAAVILGPTLAVLLIFVIPEYLFGSDSASVIRFMWAYLTILGLLSSIILGAPLSILLRDIKQDGYWQYALAGLIPPALYLFVIIQMSSKRVPLWAPLQYLLCGVVAALIFRLIRGGVGEDTGEDRLQKAKANRHSLAVASGVTVDALFKNQLLVEVNSFADVGVASFPNNPFIAIVEANFGNATHDHLWDLANKLIDYDAMLVAAIGSECTIFDDTVDQAWVEKNLDDQDTAPRVMTTWHDDETLQEVVEFMALNNLVFDEWKVEKYDLMILRIGTNL